jgi:TNF receptor-associated protein 1
MSRDELIRNLGTIAHSGTQEFMRKLQQSTSEASSASEATNLIGQFGVGFYSTFMVADKVTVYSRSAEPDSVGHVWSSTGDGRYEIAEASGVSRGTKIILSLKADCKEFSEVRTIEGPSLSPLTD